MGCGGKGKSKGQPKGKGGKPSYSHVHGQGKGQAPGVQAGFPDLMSTLSTLTTLAQCMGGMQGGGQPTTTTYDYATPATYNNDYKGKGKGWKPFICQHRDCTWALHNASVAATTTHCPCCIRAWDKATTATLATCSIMLACLFCPLTSHYSAKV